MIYYLLVPFKRLKSDVFPLPSRTLAFVFFIALFLLPLFVQTRYILGIVTIAAIFAIYAASWDLLSGITGQLSFGHAAFFGVAGYTSVLLNLHLGWPVPATIVLGTIAAVVMGLIVGLPALRLRGLYLP